MFFFFHDTLGKEIRLMPYPQSKLSDLFIVSWELFITFWFVTSWYNFFSEPYILWRVPKMSVWMYLKKNVCWRMWKMALSVSLHRTWLATLADRKLTIASQQDMQQMAGTRQCFIWLMALIRCWWRGEQLPCLFGINIHIFSIPWQLTSFCYFVPDTVVQKLLLWKS